MIYFPLKLTLITDLQDILMYEMIQSKTLNISYSNQ